jgi:peptide methionine sulfoxide reductase MsrA
MGGYIKNPSYREVCSGRTGHTEAIKIKYDKNIISYSQLLEIFFYS